MDSTQFANCQSCLVLNKKLELFDLLKQKCCKNDDIAKTLLQLKKSSERSAKLLDKQAKKLTEAKCRVAELEKAEEVLSRKIVDYQLKLVAADNRYRDLQKDVEIEHENYKALNEEKLQLLNTLEIKENAITSLTLISKQTEEQCEVTVMELKEKLEKSQELIKTNGKSKKRTAALQKKYNKLVESLLQVFKDDVINAGEPLKRLKTHVKRLKSKDDAAKLEAELNRPSLTPDGTTSSDTGIFSGDEDFGAPSSLADDLQMSSDSSDDEFEEVQQSANSTTVAKAAACSPISSSFQNPLSSFCNKFENTNSNPLPSLESGFLVTSVDDAHEKISSAFNDVVLDGMETNSECHASLIPESSNEVSAEIAVPSCEADKEVLPTEPLSEAVDDSSPIFLDFKVPAMDPEIVTNSSMQKLSVSDLSSDEESLVKVPACNDIASKDDDILNRSAKESMNKATDLSSSVKTVTPLIPDKCTSGCESIELRVARTPDCTSRLESVASLEKGNNKENISSRTSPSSSTAFVGPTNLSNGCKSSAASEAIISTSAAVNDSQIFEEEDADDLLSDQESSSAETDLETMLSEWNTPTPVLPFSEDSSSYGGKIFDSQLKEPFDTMLVPTLSENISVLSSHSDATKKDVQIAPRKPVSHSVCKVSIGTNTDAPESLNNSSSAVSFLSKAISSNDSNSDLNHQEESIHTKGLLKSTFTSTELLTCDRSVSPIRLHSRDVGVGPIEELRRSVAISPIRHKKVSTATSPIQCLHQNRATSPIKCIRRDAASSPVKILLKSSATSPFKVKQIDAETSPIKLEPDRGSPNSLENDNHFNHFSELWHSTSQVHTRGSVWSQEAQMLQGAVEMLGINSGDLAGVVIDETLVEELRHAIEVALKKARQGSNSPPSGLSTSVLKKKSFCMFDPCEFEELCNQQHYNLHLLAKSKNLEEKICALGQPKKPSVKRLENSRHRRKEANFVLNGRSPSKIKPYQKGSVLPVTGRDTSSSIQFEDPSFCSVENGPEGSSSPGAAFSSGKTMEISVCKSPSKTQKAPELPFSTRKHTVSSRDADLSTASCKSPKDSEALHVLPLAKVTGIERIRKSVCSGTIVEEITKESSTSLCNINPQSPSKPLDNALSIQTATLGKSSPPLHSTVLSRIPSPSTEKLREPSVIKDSDATNNPSPREDASSSVLVPDITVDLVIDTSCDSELDRSKEDIRPELDEDNCDLINEHERPTLKDDVNIKPCVRRTSRARKRVSLSSESSTTDSSPDPGAVSIRRSSRAKKIRVVHDWGSGSKGSYELGYMKFVKGGVVFVSKEPDKVASEVQVPAFPSNPGQTESVEAGCTDASTAPSDRMNPIQIDLSEGNDSSPLSSAKVAELSEVSVSESSSLKGRLSNIKSNAVKRSAHNESSSHGTIPKRQKNHSSEEIVAEHFKSAGSDSLIPSGNIASNVIESKSRCEASLDSTRQMVPSAEERLASASSLRSHAPMHKPSKLQKLRSKVSRIHPLAQGGKSPKSFNENDKMNLNKSPAESSLERSPKLPETSHLTLDCVKTAKSEAEILEKFKGRECLRMAAAQSGRTAQLIIPSEGALARRRAAAERLSSLKSSGLQPQKRISGRVKLQPLVCPEDRIHAIANNLPVPNRTVKSPNTLHYANHSTKERVCKPGTKVQATSLIQESLPLSKKTGVSFLVNHSDNTRKTSLSPLACVISDQQGTATPPFNKEDLQFTEKLVADTLKAFVAAPLFTPGVLQKAIDSLASPQTYNIAPVIVRDVVKMMDDDYDTPILKSRSSLPSVPILTPIQQQLVTLVLQLSFQLEHLKLLPQQVLELLEYRMFRLGKGPEGDRIIWCSRLHAAICRALCLRSRLLIFCWDSLYTFRGKSYNIIKTVLDVWPNLFPINPSFEKACPNAQVMLHFLRSHGGKSEGGHLTQKFDNSWLKRLLSCAGVQTVSLNSSDLASKIFSSLLDGGDETNLSALILLAKREDEQWTIKDLIGAKLLPALERWRCKDLDDFGGERVIWTTCSILRQLPLNRSGNNATLLIKLLKSELLRSESQALSPHMQEVVAIGLALLSRHDIENVAFSLLPWNPEHGSSLGLSSSLLHYLSSMVKSTSRTMPWWQGCLSLDLNTSLKPNLEE